MSDFGIKEVVQQIAPAPENADEGGSGSESGAAAGEAEGNPSDAPVNPEQDITVDGDQPADNPPPAEGEPSEEPSGTPPSGEEPGTSETGSFLDVLADVAEAVVTDTSEPAPQQPAPTQTGTSTSSSAQTSDASLQELLASVTSDDATVESLQKTLAQATALLPTLKPQETFQRTQEEGEIQSEEEQKAQQAKLQKQQLMQEGLRDVFRNGRIKAQQLAQAAEAAQNPKAAALARKLGSQFTAGQKKLAEMETQRMQELSKSLFKEYGSLMKGGKLSPANQVVAKGAAEDGDDVAPEDLAEADEMAEPVGDLTPEEEAQQKEALAKRAAERKAQPSWQREQPESDSLEALQKNEELARQQTTQEKPTETKLQKTIDLLASVVEGPYKLTQKAAQELKERIRTRADKMRAGATVVANGTQLPPHKRVGEIMSFLRGGNNSSDSSDTAGQSDPSTLRQRARMFFGAFCDKGSALALRDAAEPTPCSAMTVSTERLPQALDPRYPQDSRLLLDKVAGACRRTANLFHADIGPGVTASGDYVSTRPGPRDVTMYDQETEKKA